MSGCFGLDKSSDAVGSVRSASAASVMAAWTAPNGFYPYAEKWCASCHTAQMPTFALTDPSSAERAMAAFLVGNQANYDALMAHANNGHCGNAGCTNASATIKPMIDNWLSAVNSSSQGPSAPVVSESLKYMLAPLAIPASISSSAFVPMRWQMPSVSPAPPNLSTQLAGSIFELEIQLLNNSEYFVRNPKIAGLKGPVEVKGVHVLLKKASDPGNGAEDPAGTLWDKDDVQVQTSTLPGTLPTATLSVTTFPPIDTNGMGISVISGSDMISIGFDDLLPGQVVTPTTAKFSSIFANVIMPKCLSCHSAANANTLGGGNDLSTYNGVLNYVNTANPTASAIYIDVNSGAMPQGGQKLSATDISAILSWIQAGALNN